MKKIFKFLVIATIAIFGFSSCEEDSIVNNGTNASASGNGLYGFAKNGEKLNLDQDGGIYTHKIYVDVSTVSNVDRVIQYDIMLDETDPGQITYANAIVPANSHNGYIELAINKDLFTVGEYKFISYKLSNVLENTIFNNEKTVYNLNVGIPCLVSELEGFYEGNTWWNDTSYHNVTVDEANLLITIEDFFPDNAAKPHLILKYDPVTFTVKLNTSPGETGFLNGGGSPGWILYRDAASAGRFDPCTKVIEVNINYYIQGLGSFGDKVETFRML